MKSLIVNADDLGAGPRRNAGILHAHRRGIVTSASVLATAPAFRHAMGLLRASPSLDAGLHLNLSEGAPLAAGHRTLVGADGLFLGKDEARRRALAGLFDPGEVERETEAQLGALAPLRVTHLDAHHHLHVYGPVAEPVALAAARAGLRWVRCPADDPADRSARVEEYRRLAARARDVYAAAGLRTTEHFRGAALSGALDEEGLAEALRRLPDGLCELMVHPGYADADDGFAGPAREVELRALTSPRVRSLLEELGVRLARFDAP